MTPNPVIHEKSAGDTEFSLLSLSDLMAIPDSLCPLLVVSDNPFALFGLLIRRHDHGYYTHSMWLHRQGLFASQELTYKEIPVESCRDCRLKLWTNVEWTRQQRFRLFLSIQHGLAEPWWRRRYDFLGIIGQAIGLNWIQNPLVRYCSERVAADLRRVEPEFKMTRPTPSEINDWCKRRGNWRVIGVYDPTLTPRNSAGEVQ